jgi:RpiB/LacA/LacB family sugar-phosphate isomerase
MRTAIGSDHAGFEMKGALAKHLRDLGHEALDVGTYSSEPVDYPDFAESVKKAVLDGRADRGVLICGSGAGASMAANKIHGDIVSGAMEARFSIMRPEGGTA